MKKNILILTALFFVLIAQAQTPDFSGKWKLNSTKSVLGTEFSMAPLEITVVHKGNDFAIEKHSDFQGETFTTTEKYTLDGKECVNPAMMDMQRKSTVALSADKKSFTITSKLDANGEEISIKEIYRMEGGSLIIESSSNSSFGDFSEKMVYDKV